jgi:hypothetical protein
MLSLAAAIVGPIAGGIICLLSMAYYHSGCKMMCLQLGAHFSDFTDSANPYPESPVRYNFLFTRWQIKIVSVLFGCLLGCCYELYAKHVP